MSDPTQRPNDADIEAKLRGFTAADLNLVEPPERVWQGIESALLNTGDASSDDTGTDNTDPVVVPLEPHRRRARRFALPSVAAAALAIAGIAAYAVIRDNPDVIATAALVYDSDRFDPLGAQAQASAELIVQDSRHRIDLIDAQLPTAGADADLEAWLIQPDSQGNVADLVSLGLVDPADKVSLVVPEGYDPLVYSVVDISVEPRDGDPAHSGRSILRGALGSP